MNNKEKIMDEKIEIERAFKVFSLRGVKIKKTAIIEHMFLIEEDKFLEKLTKLGKKKIIEKISENSFKVKIEDIPIFYKGLSNYKTKRLVITTEEDWDFVVIEEDEIERIENLINNGYVFVELKGFDKDDNAFFFFRKEDVIDELKSKVEFIEPS